MRRILAAVLFCLPAAAANITVAPSTTYQTWHYWMSLLQPTPGAFQPTPGAIGPAEPSSNPNWNGTLKPALLGQLVNELGINTVQLTVASGDIENNFSINGNDCWTYYNLVTQDLRGWSTCRYSPVNDDGDPGHFNCPDISLVNCPGSFPMVGMDYAFDNYIAGPGGLKALVNANGESLHIDFQWIHWPTAPTFIDMIPGEAGEQILAAFTHIRNKYGAQYVPDILDMMVEPDLHCIASNITAGDCGQGGQWDFRKLGNVMYAVQARLSAAGFHPQIWCCSTTSSQHAKDWYMGVKSQGSVAPGMTVPAAFTTHWYDAPNTSKFAANTAQASADGVPIVMTELDNIGIDAIYSLITSGNVSGIEKYDPAIVGTSSQPSSLLNVTSVNRYVSQYVGSASGPTYTYYFPQLWHYVREGDVRAQATSSDANFLPLAFRSPAGLDKVVVLVHSSGNQAVNVGGVSAGTYGCTYTYSNAVLLHPCGPNQTIAAGGTLTANLPSIPPNPPSSPTAAVVTFFELPSAAPVINLNGVVPIDSSAPIIQPGSWVSIYGSNLANGVSLWSADFPTSLGGVSVTIDNKPAYLWLVSPNQINLQAPDDTTTGLVNVVVTTPNGTATSTVTLAPAAPSFSLQQSPQPNSLYPAAQIFTALGYDGLLGPAGVFSFASRPVRAGESLVLYGVGFGPTATPVPAGQPFSGSVDTAQPVSVMIGGLPAHVSFAGLVAAGVYQINVVIPNAGAGDQPIVATVGGIQTPSGVYVTIE